MRRRPMRSRLRAPRLAYGERLRRARNRVLAREQLRAAVETFECLDAVPWADRARAELAATGETLRRRDPSTIDELTPQELQIALMLAAGKTTREAAAALFLSPKTVEYHLRHIYQKLDIHSRTELGQKFATQAAHSGPHTSTTPLEHGRPARAPDPGSNAAGQGLGAPRMRRQPLRTYGAPKSKSS